MQVSAPASFVPQKVGEAQVKMTPSMPSAQRRIFTPPSGSQRTLPSDEGAQRSPTEFPLVSQSTVSAVAEQPPDPLQSA